MSFRPRLEQFEARLVPAGATYTWTNDGGDGLFSNPDNWLEGDKPAWAPPPGHADFLVFDGSVTQAPCVGLTGSYEAIFVLDFTAIDLGGDVQTKLLDLGGGEFRNTADGQDITVTQQLTWTQGAINSSTYSGALNLDGSAALDSVAGAAALIAPAGGGAVSLGSTLNLLNGAVATMQEGTLNLTGNGLGMNIFGNCGFLVNPGPDKVCRTESVGVHFNRQISIFPAAYFTVLTGEYTSTNVPLHNDGGRFTLESNTAAFFGGKVIGAPGDPSFYQDAGTTNIASDASLKLSAQLGGGMRLAGGSLIIRSGAKDPLFVGNVVGKLTVVGGTISIENMGGDSRQFGEFLVVGDVTWTGGTFRPFVSDSFTGEGWSDVWYVTGTFTIGGAAGVVATAVDGENNEVTPTAGMEWELFHTLGGIMEANNTPSLNAGWTFVKDPINNPKKWWHLKS